jgi:hypothetical protein
MDIKCYDGVMSTSKAKFGIMSTDLDKQSYCLETAIWNTKVNKKSTVAHCSDYMNTAEITS